MNTGYGRLHIGTCIHRHNIELRHTLESDAVDNACCSKPHPQEVHQGFAVCFHRKSTPGAICQQHFHCHDQIRHRALVVAGAMTTERHRPADGDPRDDGFRLKRQRGLGCDDRLDRISIEVIGLSTDGE